MTPLREYDDAMAAAGFGIQQRWSTWDADPFDPAAGYVVTVHEHAGADS